MKTGHITAEQVSVEFNSAQTNMQTERLKVTVFNYDLDNILCFLIDDYGKQAIIDRLNQLDPA